MLYGYRGPSTELLIIQFNMDQSQLHKLLAIDEDLEKNEVAQLKFLCTDLVQKKRLETVSDAKDLFVRLEEQGLLEDELLIPELLITIKRFDLLAILEKSKEEVESVPLKYIKPYRKMLYSLSEDMTEENFSAVKFLSDLPKAKLRTSSSFLDIMIEMEKLQRLGEDNLDELHNILHKCDKQLACRIEEFKNRPRDQEEVGDRHPLQEVSNHEHFRVNNSQRTETVDEHSSSGIENLVTDSQTTTRDDAQKEYYTISHKPVGHCLIVNNYNFERCQSLKIRNRTGTDKDKDELKRVFEKMRFAVEVQEDLKASEMLNVMKEFAERDHSQMDVFVCCILSHGEKGTVLGVDGNQVEIRELTLPFAKCRTLAEKPKLFFIQACQGSVGQEGLWLADGQEDSTEEGTYEEDARMVVQHSIPIEADFLIGMATVEHYQSFRHTIDGSIYIQELCKQLEILCPRQEDILSILTKVNCEVSEKILKGYKQMPEPRYTLRKKLILPMD